jgi:hypothetical protein
MSFPPSSDTDGSIHRCHPADARSASSSLHL